jgi:hypothetical protein
MKFYNHGSLLRIVLLLAVYFLRFSLCTFWCNRYRLDQQNAHSFSVIILILQNYVFRTSPAHHQGVLLCTSIATVCHSLQYMALWWQRQCVIHRGEFVHRNWSSICAPRHTLVSRLLQLLCTHRGCSSYCAHTKAAQITVHTQRLLQLLCTHKGCLNYCAHTEAALVTVHTQRLLKLLCTHRGCSSYCAHTKAAQNTVHTQRLLQLLYTHSHLCIMQLRCHHSAVRVYCGW